MKFLLIFLGGGLGSVFRYAISKYLNNLETPIPYGTLLVNVLGSFLIGIILGLSMKNNGISQNQTLFFAVGFCGGFTTFSTFAFENNTFLKNGDYLNFAWYILLTVIIAITAVMLGLFLTK